MRRVQVLHDTYASSVLLQCLQRVVSADAQSRDDALSCDDDVHIPQ